MLRFAIQILAYAVGLPLQVLIIAALLRGWYRLYPFIFAYTIAEFLSTIVEIPSYLGHYLGFQMTKRGRAFYYWVDEGILQALILAVVVSLIYLATVKLRSRRLLRACVIGGVLAVAAVSFFLHYRPGPNLGGWMAPWTRDLNFCSAVLDLGLWALLIGWRQKDYKLLMLSGALGIRFAGGAIGEALQTLSPATAFPGGLIVMLSDLVRTYIWWQAFRERPPRNPGIPSPMRGPDRQKVAPDKK